MREQEAQHADDAGCLTGAENADAEEARAEPECKGHGDQQHKRRACIDDRVRWLSCTVHHHEGGEGRHPGEHGGQRSRWIACDRHHRQQRDEQGALHGDRQGLCLANGGAQRS